MVAAKQDMVTFKGRTDVAHIPFQPFWLLIVRGIQMFLAVLVLALAAYSGSGYYGVFGGDGVGIFASIWTILFLCYIEISTFWAPAAYNKYVHLVLECISVPIWLWAWAWLAAFAAVWGWLDVCTEYDQFDNCVNWDYVAGGPASAAKAAAAFGAIEWLLFIGTLISFGIYLHRFRRTQYEARQQGITGNAPVEEHKMGTVNQQPVYVQQQPTGYTQPTTYNQVPVDPRYQNVTMA